MLNQIDFEAKGIIEEILVQIQKRELASYLKNMSGHEHVLFLWSNKNFRDDIMKDFFY